MTEIIKAKREDIKEIYNFIRLMAIYEKLEDEHTGSIEELEKNLFDDLVAEVIFLVKDNIKIGFALYYYTFSTFLSKKTLYIEEIFIKEKYRNNGYGKKLFKYLILKAKEENVGRVEWVCLNWNEPSIKFYKKQNAVPLDEWTTFRLTEDKIKDYK